MNCGFIFPGQGSQFVGMGLEFIQKYPVARELFLRGDQVLDFSLSNICFAGPAEKLAQNQIVQPAMLTVNLAIAAVLKEYGISPAVTAGLSVGEFAALVQAKVLSYSDALYLVHQRGKIMGEALPPGKGGMLALIGLSRQKVQDLCAEVAPFGLLEPCNYNCPGQIVVGGELAAIETAESLAVARGARKAVRVDMTSPSHCSLLREAAEKFAQVLTEVTWRDAEIPVVSNFDGAASQSAKVLQEKIAQQLYHPVYWEEVVHTLEAYGLSALVEVGPGHTLIGFVRKITRKVKALNVEDFASLSETLDYLTEIPKKGGVMAS